MTTVGHTLPPLSAFLRLRPGPYAFLLESVEGGEKWARYSFLGSEPSMVFTAKGSRMSVRHADGRLETIEAGSPFEALRGLLARYQPVTVPGLPRFQGGAVGYISYDMVRHVEELPRRAKDDLKLPDAVFMFTDSLLVFDNLRHRLLLIANAHISGRDSSSLDRAYDEAAVKIGMLMAKLARPARPPAPLTFTAVEPLLAMGEEGFASTMDEPTYMERVREAKEYIAAGDAYQIVVARRLDRELRADPFTVYRALRTINPSPYLFFLRLGKTSIVGSSPEVLVRLEDDRVEERPIAGTHPRGGTEAEDEKLAAEMQADPKERAENPRHGDYRGARAHPPRTLRRRSRIRVVLGQPRLLHHHSNRCLPRRTRLGRGGRGHRGRFGAQDRVARDLLQGGQQAGGDEAGGEQASRP